MLLGIKSVLTHLYHPTIIFKWGKSHEGPKCKIQLGGGPNYTSMPFLYQKHYMF